MVLSRWIFLGVPSIRGRPALHLPNACGALARRSGIKCDIPYDEVMPNKNRAEGAVHAARQYWPNKRKN
jgi:hypothetical protein